MSLSSPDVPTPHDPAATAQQQQTYNLDTAAAAQAASSTNQINPYGSLTYQQTGTGPGGLPLYTATTKLSPEQQAILNALQSNQLTAGTQAGKVLSGADYGGPNAMKVGDATSGITKDMLDKQVAYLKPTFDHQETALDTKMRNQGLAPGNPAYDHAMDELRTSQGRQVTGFLSTAEPAAFSQALQTYNLPLDTAAKELALSQPGSVGQNLVNAPQATVQPANYTGAVASADQAAMQAYQAQVAQQNAMMSGLFGLGGTALGGLMKGGGLGMFGGAGGAGMAALSDRNAKEGIVRVGQLDNGLPVYLYRYKSGGAPMIGIMADEVSEVHPGAIIRHEGLDYVDYAKAVK